MNKKSILYKYSIVDYACKCTVSIYIDNQLIQYDSIDSKVDVLSNYIEEIRSIKSRRPPTINDNILIDDPSLGVEDFAPFIGWKRANTFLILTGQCRGELDTTLKDNLYLSTRIRVNDLYHILEAIKGKKKKIVNTVKVSILQ